MPRLARLWIRGLAALALPSLSPAEAELQRWVQTPKLDLQAPAANSKHPLQMTMDSTPSVGHGANGIWQAGALEGGKHRLASQQSSHFILHGWPSHLPGQWVNGVLCPCASRPTAGP